MAHLLGRASVKEHVGESGTVTYRVRWVQGGRGGSWESELFSDPASAGCLKRFVDELEVPDDMSLSDFAWTTR